MDLKKQYDEMMDDVARAKALEGTSHLMFDHERLKAQYRKLENTNAPLHIKEIEHIDSEGGLLSIIQFEHQKPMGSK
jgi:hypothetical protein